MRPDSTPVNPSGLCFCGCGETTNINRDTKQHNRYVYGHQRRQWQPTPPNPSSLCLCGCGQTTPIAQMTDITYRHMKGEHVAYCVGHAPVKPLVITEIDRGYATPCWIPNRVGARRGYRTTMIHGERKALHRRMYEAKHGPIPEGLVLDHLCRQTDCCNPDHTQPVTTAENVRRGIGTKLTPEDVQAIRTIGYSQPLGETAKQFGVSRSQICRILKGIRW